MMISLTTLILFPIIGSIAILFAQRKHCAESTLKYIALLSSISCFVVSLLILNDFDIQANNFQFVQKYILVSSLGLNYFLGIDGISLYLILLTSFLIPICLLVSIKTVKEQLATYLIMFLLLESCIIGVFCSLNLILFYIFFEAMLIPMFLIIGIWGGQQKIYAAYKFFLYTFAGSILLLIAIIYIYNQTNSVDLPTIAILVNNFSFEVQKWLFLAMFASFAIKIPMWPFHTWLPLAHVQAPTAGSMILAGIMLKMGGYGFLRFCLPLVPEAVEYFRSCMFILSGIAIIYGSILAIKQSDMKKLIAYSSIGHMGFVTIGIFSLNSYGITGAIFQMISHGLISAALFLAIGILYEQTHTRKINDYGGIAKRMPIFAIFMMIFVISSIGVPGTSSFIGELLVLIGAYQANNIIAVVASMGLILSAIYMLWLYKKVMLGVESTNIIVSDLNMMQLSIFLILSILILLIGIYPKLITDNLEKSISSLLVIYR